MKRMIRAAQESQRKQFRGEVHNVDFVVDGQEVDFGDNLMWADKIVRSSGFLTGSDVNGLVDAVGKALVDQVVGSDKHNKSCHITNLIINFTYDVSSSGNRCSQAKVVSYDISFN